MTRLYLAYGSNMNKRQMQRRCPAAKPLRAIVVQDARLVFRGVADIEFCEGASCPVVLWEITEACERALDGYEGVGQNIYRKLMIPLDNGEQALCYVMNDKGIYPPQREYYQRIADGYADFAIELEPLEVALKHSHVKQSHSAATRRRMVRSIASGRNIVERKPMHVPLAKVDPNASTAITTATATAADEVCRHGWPLGICETCEAQATLDLNVPLPKSDRRYDGYNWSAAAKAGSRKAKVVYSSRDEMPSPKLAPNKRAKDARQQPKKKVRNLTDYLNDKRNGGGNY